MPPAQLMPGAVLSILTVTAPLGSMEPFGPAEAVIVNVSMAKVAAIVWFAVTLVNV